MKPINNSVPKKHHYIRNTSIAVVALIILALLTPKIWLTRVMALQALYVVHDKQLATPAVPRALTAAQGLTPQTYTFQNVSFQTPWGEPTHKRGTSALALNFQVSDRKPSIAIFSGVNFYDELIGKPEVHRFFGQQITTNYDAYNYIQSLEPSDIHLLAAPTDFLPKSILLVLKSTSIPAGIGPTYEITTANGLRGFEDVNSATSTWTVLFTKNDVPYNVIINNATPQETDSILQSFKEIPN